MRREAVRKKWIGLALIIILCVTGVYGAGAVDDIPAYTSFSCPAEASGAADCAAAQSIARSAHMASVPLRRLYQNNSVRLPDVVRPSERIQQSRIDMLRQGRPGRQSGHKYTEEIGCGTGEDLQRSAGIRYSRESIETAVFPCRSRIISYIHNQDGQKENIL